jgi:hypothetical protein
VYKGLAQRSAEAIFHPLNLCQLADNRLLRRANWIELQAKLLTKLLKFLGTFVWKNDVLGIDDRSGDPFGFRK